MGASGSHPTVAGSSPTPHSWTHAPRHPTHSNTTRHPIPMLLSHHSLKPSSCAASGCGKHHRLAARHVASAGCLRSAGTVGRGFTSGAEAWLSTMTSSHWERRAAASCSLTCRRCREPRWNASNARMSSMLTPTSGSSDTSATFVATSEPHLIQFALDVLAIEYCRLWYVLYYLNASSWFESP